VAAIPYGKDILPGGDKAILMIQDGFVFK